MLTLSQTSACQLTLASADDTFAVELEDRKNGIGDVEIVVNDKSIKTHQAVLTRHSDYFKTMFEGGFAEGTTGSVDLSNVFESSDEVNSFLDFMYTGTMKLSEDNILSILNAASLFLLSDLQAACSEFLIVNVAPSTCISIFIVAETYSLKELQGVCVEVIRSWFPFTLHESQEAIEMPPECLKILIAENVFGLLSDETRETFLRKWLEHFSISATSNVCIPKEVEDLIKTNTDGDQCGEQAQKAESATNEDELEEVLFTLMVAPPKGSDQCCVELYAFAPRLRTWKLVLRHAFSSIVKPRVIPKLIGVSEKKALFFFKRHKVTDRKEMLLIAVDLQSKAETVIRIPTSIYGKPHFLLWDDLLCALFFDGYDEKWVFSKNDHEGKCNDTCDGNCWENACDIIRYMGKGEIDHFQCSDFLTKVYGNHVYIWKLEPLAYALTECYCISKTENKCHMSKLPAPWEHEYPEDSYWENNCVNDEKCADGYFSDEDTPSNVMSSISVDSSSSTLKFILMRNHEEERVSVDSYNEYHREHVYTLDATTNEWKDAKLWKLDYPEDCPGPLKSDEFDECDAFIEYKGHPFGTPYHTTDEYNRSRYVGHFCTSPQVIYDYYMRQTSPYNTSIWKLEPEGIESQIITYLPHALYKFQGYLPSEMRLGFLKTLPKASFQDFSEKVGHSAVVYVYPPSAKFQLVYNGRLLFHNEYEDLWAHLWEEYIKTKSS